MKILIVDDHAMIRAGLKQFLADSAASVLEADNGLAALALQKQERPLVTLLDLNMPGLSGLELLRQLLEVDPAARILVFSMHGDPVYSVKALAIGAKGYLSKNAAPEELRTALSRISAGLTYVESEIAQQLVAGDQRQQLSDRDLDILRLLGEGRSFTEIAANLGLAYKTVANTTTAIKAKLGVAHTTDLIRLAVEMALVSKPQADHSTG